MVLLPIMVREKPVTVEEQKTVGEQVLEKAKQFAPVAFIEEKVGGLEEYLMRKAYEHEASAAPVGQRTVVSTPQTLPAAGYAVAAGFVSGVTFLFRPWIWPKTVEDIGKVIFSEKEREAYIESWKTYPLSQIMFLAGTFAGGYAVGKGLGKIFEKGKIARIKEVAVEPHEEGVKLTPSIEEKPVPRAQAKLMIEETREIRPRALAGVAEMGREYVADIPEAGQAAVVQPLAETAFEKLYHGKPTVVKEFKAPMILERGGQVYVKGEAPFTLKFKGVEEYLVPKTPTEEAVTTPKFKLYVKAVIGETAEEAKPPPPVGVRFRGKGPMTPFSLTMEPEVVEPAAVTVPKVSQSAPIKAVLETPAPVQAVKVAQHVSTARTATYPVTVLVRYPPSARQKTILFEAVEETVGVREKAGASAAASVETVASVSEVQKTVGQATGVSALTLTVPVQKVSVVQKSRVAADVSLKLVSGAKTRAAYTPKPSGLIKLKPPPLASSPFLSARRSFGRGKRFKRGEKYYFWSKKFQRIFGRWVKE